MKGFRVDDIFPNLIALNSYEQTIKPEMPLQTASDFPTFALASPIFDHWNWKFEWVCNTQKSLYFRQFLAIHPHGIKVEMKGERGGWLNECLRTLHTWNCNISKFFLSIHKRQTFSHFKIKISAKVIWMIEFWNSFLGVETENNLPKRLRSIADVPPPLSIDHWSIFDEKLPPPRAETTNRIAYEWPAFQHTRRRSAVEIKRRNDDHPPLQDERDLFTLLTPSSLYAGPFPEPHTNDMLTTSKVWLHLVYEL